MAAPLVAIGGIEAAAIAGPQILAADLFLKDAGIYGATLINSAKNAAVDALGGAFVQYGPASMIFNTTLFSAVNYGYGVTLTGSNLYPIFTTVGSFTGLFPAGLLLPKY